MSLFRPALPRSALFRSALFRPLLAFGVLFGSTAVVPVARAAHQTVAAEDLELSTPCIGRVDVDVDPAMSDGVSLDTSAASAAHVTIRTAKNESASRVTVASKSCAPSARLSVLIAPNVGVSIHDSHDTHFVLHGTVASVEASLEAGRLEADAVQSLDLSLRGTEQVEIAHLNRAAQVVASGSASLVVDHADLDALSAQLSDATRLMIADGRFGALTLSSEGAAVATLSGTVDTATVTANGTGLLTIPKVNGVLSRNGNGPVQIGPAAAAPAATVSAQPAPARPVPEPPAPVQPAPVQPAPTQPVPTQPGAVQPAPVQPLPAQPVPASPPSVQSPAPAPSQPAPQPPATVPPERAAPAVPAPASPPVAAKPPATPDAADTADDPMQTETPPTDEPSHADPNGAAKDVETKRAMPQGTQTEQGAPRPGPNVEGRQP